MPETVFIVSTYNAADKLAHTPAGTPAGVGLYTVELDDGGRLRALDAVPAAPNPAFCVKHPHLPLLYCSTECIDADGEVMAYAMDDDGGLRLLSKRSSVRAAADWGLLLPSSSWQAGLHAAQRAERGRGSLARAQRAQSGRPQRRASVAARPLARPLGTPRRCTAEV